MNIIVYTKTGCPWCANMKIFLEENDIEYQEKNVTQNDDYYNEMKELSGQDKAPTLNIDGQVFADADVEDIRDIVLGTTN